MKYEYSLPSISLQGLPNTGAGAAACPHVWVRKVCIQSLPESENGCVVRKSGENRLQRHSQDADRSKETNRNAMVARRFQCLLATVFTKSRHGFQELLSREGKVPEFQKEAWDAVSSLHDKRVHIQGWKIKTGKTRQAIKHQMESPVQWQADKLHGQQGCRKPIPHLHSGRGRNKNDALCEEGSRDRSRVNSCGYHQRWAESQQSEVLQVAGKALSESSTKTIKEEKRQQQSREGTIDGRQNTRENIRSTQGFCTQTHDKANKRKPSHSSREFASKESCQEQKSIKINSGCWLASDHVHAGIQGKLVRTILCSNRQVLSIKQALSRLRAYLRQNAAISPLMGLSILRQSTRPRRKCSEEYTQGRKDHLGWWRSAKSTRKRYGGAHRNLSLWSLCKTEVAIYGGNGL